jgi:hypothetical protein
MGLTDWNLIMKRKIRLLNFDQTLELLRNHGFQIKPIEQGGALVSKYGAGAVLAPGKETPVAFAVRPGAVVQGEVARLVDRGYQKFIKSSKYELPATAAQLEAIHTFGEELKELAGGISLYNESLGTTSDRYLYDRVDGRETNPQAKAARPWELTGSH